MPIQETNITSWRRAIIGDLTNLFQSGQNLAGPFPIPPDRDEFVTAIHRAQFEGAPENPPLTNTEIEEVRKDPRVSHHIPRQQKGNRISTALPYELYADANLSTDRKSLKLDLAAAKARFGEKSLGAPFQVYAPNGFKDGQSFEKLRRWSFALSAGSALDYSWPISSFPDGRYALELHGPNGYFRSFKGSAGDPDLHARLQYAEGDVLIFILKNLSPAKAITVNLTDTAYGTTPIHRELALGQNLEVPITVASSSRWYNIRITVAGYPDYLRHYAGRVENGEDSTTDPQIGGRS